MLQHVPTLVTPGEDVPVKQQLAPSTETFDVPTGFSGGALLHQVQEIRETLLFMCINRHVASNFLAYATRVHYL